MNEDVATISGYCEKCDTDRLFKPARKDEDSGEVLSWSCSVCDLRYLDEPPEPRYATSPKDLPKKKR